MENTQQKSIGYYLNPLANMKWLTKDSKKGFLLLSGLNRPIIPSQTTKMAISDRTMGTIRPVVVADAFCVTGKHDLAIIDGQHLYFALLRNNKDIPYVEIEVKDKRHLIEQLAFLNASSRSWTSNDFITAWSNVNPAYNILKELFNKYDVDLRQLAALLHNRLDLLQGGGNMGRLIKRGDLTVVNYEQTVKILDCITDALNYVPRLSRMDNKMFIASYVNIMNNAGTMYNHKKYMKFLSENKQNLILATLDTEELNKILQKGI